MFAGIFVFICVYLAVALEGKHVGSITNQPVGQAKVMSSGWFVLVVISAVSYFAHGSGLEVLWWAQLCVCLSVCASVCLSASISLEPCTRSLSNFLCMLPMAMTRSSSIRVTKSHLEEALLGFSAPLTMHCNAIMSCSRRDHSVAAAFAANGIGWEGGDGSAQCRQSVIYDCLVSFSDLTLLIRRQEGYPSCSLLLWLFCERLFLCVTWLIRSLTSEKEASWTNKCQL